MLTVKEIEDLAGYLSQFINFEGLSIIGCNNTLLHTENWLKEYDGDFFKDEVLDWLKENGGYCDCEIILNVVSRRHEIGYDS